MDPIDETIIQLIDGKADHASIRRCLTPDTDLFEFYNALALRIASLFMEKSMSFSDADAAINNLNIIWLDDAIKYDFPEPAYSVYLAFDAGEYSVNDKDHIELYTRPELLRST
jgi:hypothetical protein